VREKGGVERPFQYFFGAWEDGKSGRRKGTSREEKKESTKYVVRGRSS
jgi:hypothetical protein